MKAVVKFYWPLLLLIALQLGFTGYLMILHRPECEPLFGVNTLVLAMLMYCYLLPATVFLGAGYMSYISYESLKSGQFPPAGMPGFKGRKVTTGAKARVLAVAGMLSPALALVVIGLGIQSYNALVGDQGLDGLQANIEQACQKGAGQR
ncbi:hypothetical protein HMF8227_00192 [Saliniradius amylolyticus]|uniref:Uncharacterized protein n=1 Tax=Saliniradius amylolyticus TaxID=2183582 RepID=A0A2S2E096_9ALTE|nr:hypothetical protein [Saliniradius amylolyticus]AWL10700.1 hypothetical protein HMF8227_00192 [Saliniradius amylolyticus]